MAAPIKICFAVSEIAPLAKTGGLADVAEALPRQLFRDGHDVRVFAPFHGVIDREGREFTPVDFADDVTIPLGWRNHRFSLWTTPLPDSTFSIYLVDCPELFHRDAVYSSGEDDSHRFAFFCKSVVESCQRMGWCPDVFHCNDWHTALIPFLLRSVYSWDDLFHRARSMVTIHNIGYQGVFPASIVGEYGFGDWAYLLDQEDLRRGRVNFLRTGLIYADLITTVSPTYAKEIQTADFGHGLEDLLRARNDRLVGVLNGVDYDTWSPEKDRFIPHRFSAGRMNGKRKNKRYILEKLGLRDTDAPLVGIVSRLTGQKGFDLCFPVLPELLATRDFRLVILGSGESRYEEFFWFLQQRFPDKVCFYRGYSDELAHLIEAGADLFLMPSRYEPCGLNQMFSLRYGTIPVVRRTGGLADSVELFDADTGHGTGFTFDHYDARGLHWALDYALNTYRNRAAWQRLRRNAMAQSFSWEQQAGQYEELYRWLGRL